MTEAVPGDHEKMIKAIEQRLREIDPSFSGLTALLQQQQVGKDELEFILYPEYQEKDNTDPKIRLATKSGASSSWLNKSATPDGGAKQIGTETLTDGPNSAWAVPQGIWKLNKATVKIDGKIMWTPSTGANQNLGEIEIIRVCTVSFDGQCP
jgi:hypothetical protein